MRYLTTLTGKTHAEAFVAYLLTLDISTHVEANESDKDRWEVWVRNEDAMGQANEELARFLESPEDPRYRQSIDSARNILIDQRKRQVARIKNIQTTKTIVNRSMFSGSLPPLTLTLIIICVVIALIQFLNPSSSNTLAKIIRSQFAFVDMSLYLETGDPAASLRKLELWRILTPAFLHDSANPLHLLMNMFALASLGRLVERLEGTARYAMILLFVAIVSHLLQGLLPAKFFGSPNFVGISGVIMGLFGYVAVKTSMRPDLGFYLPAQTYILIGLLLVLGFVGGDSVRLANMAHLGGLLAGAAMGFLLSSPTLDVKH